MKTNFKEGMFLGKQELDREQILRSMDITSVQNLLKTDATPYSIPPQNRPFNPKSSWVVIEGRTVDGVYGVAVGIDNNIGIAHPDLYKLGRGSIGSDLYAPMMNSDWTGKEAWHSLDGVSDGTYYVQIRHQETIYENALVSLDSNGLMTITKGWDYVKDLFRNAQYGRQSRVKIVDGGVFSVSSVDATNHTVQLVGEAGTFSVLTGKQFYMVPTLSPFVEQSDVNLYTYGTLVVDISDSSMAPLHPWYTIGSIEVVNGEISQVEIFGTDTNNNEYGYLDTVGYEQINTRNLADGAVTEDKIANGAVTGNKIADGAITGGKIPNGGIPTAKIADHAVTLEKIASAGVLPTDIFRIDLTTNFSMLGCGLGCILVQGEQNAYFAYDPSHPDCPYRLRIFYDSSFPKILAFSPVTPCVVAVYDSYIASPMVHYTEDGVTCQVMLQLLQATYDSLYNDGNRVLKGTVTPEIYGSVRPAVNYSVQMNKTNIINFNIPRSVLLEGYEQHIILKMTCEPAVS